MILRFKRFEIAVQFFVGNLHTYFKLPIIILSNLKTYDIGLFG